MNTKARRVHLEIQQHRGNPVGLIRSSFRKDGKVCHATYGRMTGLSLEQLRLIQAAFQGRVVPEDSPEALQISSGREYGASAVGLALAKELGLDRMIYSRSERWVRCALALIVGRLVYGGSELALSHIGDRSALWELCGVSGPIDVDRDCDAVMDRLLERQGAIQRRLAARPLQDGCLVLYDLTSSYVEGAYPQSQIMALGDNRDGKRRHQPMVIGLLCNREGCPVGVEVFAGNTQDATAVEGKIAEQQTQYGLKEIIFVGDRGLITRAHDQALTGVQGLHVISALSHPQMLELLQRGVIQPELFDQTPIVEVLDPARPQRRYFLCRNPHTAQQQAKTREALLGRTIEALNRIASAQRRAKVEKISAQVGQLLQKSKTGKFVNWSVEDGRLVWRLDEEALRTEALLDGCYVVYTDWPAERMSKEEAVASYRKLGLVEEAFRNLKTVWLEVRPIYHKTEDRIRAHVFLCMLAYYLQWPMKRRLAPLFESDGRGKGRKWTFPSVMASLRQITIHPVRMGQSAV